MYITIDHQLLLRNNPYCSQKLKDSEKPLSTDIANSVLFKDHIIIVVF